MNQDGEGTNLCAARQGRGSLNLIPPIHFTMVITMQSVCQSKIRATFLLISCDNSIIPLDQSYSPINQLQSCYGDHAQTCVGSCSIWVQRLPHHTVKPGSVSRQPDNPSLGVFFFTFFITTVLHPLNKVVLLR
jgi:hypothetical protein